ncbi:MAG: hypothetical protein HN737_11580 [Desulfobacterales bacterium]|jgi:hypothetical protein|nr:hypothetical protein [Desulfobacteraceae bacterium]MBT7087175.1 hypothetical protein [Desulfobacterales bacterium]MBT7698035.1 hypothetical protein [Desulfobacterales bacterium]
MFNSNTNLESGTKLGGRSFYDDDHNKGSCIAAERGLTKTGSVIVEFQELNKLYDIGIRNFKGKGAPV